MKRLIIILMMLIFLVAGCNKEDAWDFVKTRGEYAVEERDISAFHAITVKNGVNVTLIHGDNYAATVEGWKNLMPKIRFIEQNGELIIEDVNKYNFMRSRNNMSTVHLTIPVNELGGINFLGNGDIITKDTLVTSGLSIISFGSGNIDMTVKTQGIYIGTNHENIALITIRGESYDVGITNWGFSPVDLSNLKTSYVNVAQRGIGSVYVNVSEYINVIFYSGIGNVYYTGNPSSINFAHEEKGKGNLYKIDNP